VVKNFIRVQVAISIPVGGSGYCSLTCAIAYNSAEIGLIYDRFTKEYGYSELIDEYETWMVDAANNSIIWNCLIPFLWSPLNEH
jgi:hypothetical protein